MTGEPDEDQARDSFLAAREAYSASPGDEDAYTAVLQAEQDLAAARQRAREAAGTSGTGAGGDVIVTPLQED